MPYDHHFMPVKTYVSRIKLVPIHGLKMWPRHPALCPIGKTVLNLLTTHYVIRSLEVAW